MCYKTFSIVVIRNLAANFANFLFNVPTVDVSPFIEYLICNLYCGARISSASYCYFLGWVNPYLGNVAMVSHTTSTLKRTNRSPCVACYHDSVGTNHCNLHSHGDFLIEKNNRTKQTDGIAQSVYPLSCYKWAPTRFLDLEVLLDLLNKKSRNTTTPPLLFWPTAELAGCPILRLVCEGWDGSRAFPLRSQAARR